jgi:hypothetical protein
MALNLSQTASSMGIISGRQREAERAEWQARVEEMRLQAFNREELNRQQDTQTAQQMLAGLNFNPTQNYNAFYNTDVRQVPVEAPAPAPAPAPAAPAPAAAPVVAAPAAAAPAAPPAGVRLPEARVNAPTVPGTNIPLRSPVAAQNIADWQARTGQKLPAGVEKFSQGQTTTHLTVPDFNPNLPSRAGLVDAEGIPKIDPNSAGFQRSRQEGAARSAIIQQREQIATGLATGKFGPAGAPSGQMYGYFFDNKSEAEKRDIATAAMKWFRSDESLAYFMQNPQALAQAKVDPMGFYAAFAAEAPVREARRQSESRTEQPSTGAPEVVGGKLQPKKLDEKFVANSAKVTDKRIEQLTPMLPKILEKAETKQILNRAGVLQVDPAAALAVYGLESNFGAATKDSGAGASGPLQVMPDTFGLMKNWYTNAENIKKYNIPQAQVEAARNMQFDASGKIDAGLLVLKYNEYIGNPKNLWGAGYQGNADQVKKFGRPLNAHDGTLLNSDYNRGFVALYNTALTALSGNQQPLAAAAAPAAAPAPAPAAAPAPAPAAAPVATAPAPAAAPAAAPAPAPAAAPAPAPAAAAAVTNVEKQQIKMPPAGTIDPNTYDQFTKQALQLRDYTRQLAVNAANSGNPAKALEFIGKIYSTDLDLYRMMGDRGVAEFTRFNDPTRMVGVWSQFTGQKLQLQPRSDGKWDLFSNGKPLAQGVSSSDLIGYAKEDIDSKYLSSKTALKEFMFKESFKTEQAIRQSVATEQAKASGQIFIDTNKINRQLIADISKDINAGNIKMAQTAFENATGVKVTMSPDGSGKALIASNDGSRIGVVDMSAGTITLNGETINKAPGSLFVLGSGMPSAGIPIFGPSAEKAGVRPPAAGLLVNP